MKRGPTQQYTQAKYNIYSIILNIYLIIFTILNHSLPLLLPHSPFILDIICITLINIFQKFNNI